jgi:uncharacterized lipoprotein NlpE involved in copper resistance
MLLSRYPSAIVISSGFSSAAATPAAKPAAPDHHTSQNSLDWQGTYTGVAPCAICKGIEITLTINKDLTYVLNTRRLGNEDKAIVNQGTFTWGKNGREISLKGLTEIPSRYFVGENRLLRLNECGEKAEGTSAEKYILRKMP